MRRSRRIALFIALLVLGAFFTAAPASADCVRVIARYSPPILAEVGYDQCVATPYDAKVVVDSGVIPTPAGEVWARVHVPLP